MRKKKNKSVWDETSDVMIGLTKTNVTAGVGAAIAGRAVAMPGACAAAPGMAGFTTASGFVPMLSTMSMGGIAIKQAKKLGGKKKSKYY